MGKIMYNPSNGLVNAMMRWPALGGVVAGVTALSTDGIVATAASFVAGTVAGTYGVTKLFNDQICNCEDKGYMKLGDAKIEWIVEYSPETGAERPWDVYTMFAGIEATKQHYASYSTEEHARSKIEKLKEAVSKVTKK